MTVEMSDFEAKVVRSALMEYALNIQIATPPELTANREAEDAVRSTHRTSLVLVMESANDISERLEELLKSKGNVPTRNTFRDAAK